METLVIILILIVGVFLGLFFGMTGAKIKKSLFERKIVKNAQKVINGKIKNQTLDENGKPYEVNRFKVRDEDNKEISIDLSGKRTDELTTEKISLLPNLPNEKSKKLTNNFFINMFKNRKNGKTKQEDTNPNLS